MHEDGLLDSTLAAIEPPAVPPITAPMLAAISIYAREGRFEKFLGPLHKTFDIYHINSALRRAHFIAQLMHESGEFHYLEEIASGAAYEGRRDLGNTRPGDGKLFKGRGLIQLTGRDNYRRYTQYIQGAIDFEKDPDLVAELPWCVDVAGWFWDVEKNLNPLADKGDVVAITRRINGGLNGLAQRQIYLERAKRTMGII